MGDVRPSLNSHIFTGSSFVCGAAGRIVTLARHAGSIRSHDGLSNPLQVPGELSVDMDAAKRAVTHALAGIELTAIKPLATVPSNGNTGSSATRPRQQLQPPSNLLSNRQLLQHNAVARGLSGAGAGPGLTLGQQLLLHCSSGLSDGARQQRSPFSAPDTCADIFPHDDLGLMLSGVDPRQLQRPPGSLPMRQSLPLNDPINMLPGQPRVLRQSGSFTNPLQPQQLQLYGAAQMFGPASNASSNSQLGGLGSQSNSGQFGAPMRPSTWPRAPAGMEQQNALFNQQQAALLQQSVQQQQQALLQQQQQQQQQRAFMQQQLVLQQQQQQHGLQHQQLKALAMSMVGAAPPRSTLNRPHSLPAGTPYQTTLPTAAPPLQQQQGGAGNEMTWLLEQAAAVGQGADLYNGAHASTDSTTNGPLGGLWSQGSGHAGGMWGGAEGPGVPTNGGPGSGSYRGFTGGPSAVGTVFWHVLLQARQSGNQDLERQLQVRVAVCRRVAVCVCVSGVGDGMGEGGGSLAKLGL